MTIASIPFTLAVKAKTHMSQGDMASLLSQIEEMQQRNTMFAIFVLILIVILIAVCIFAWSKRMEAQDYKQQLLRLDDELDRQHAALVVQKDFAHQSSHQMRTPINAIVGFAELLREDTDLSAQESTEYTDILIDNAHRLVRVMDDFMAYTALERELYTLQLRQESIMAILDEAVSRVVPMVKPNVSMVLNTTMQEDYTVLIDRLRLVQLLTKLLQYVSVLTSSGEIKVDVIVLPTENMVKYKIYAEFVKCTPVQKRHLFDRYYRMPSDRESSGLELPICRLLAEMLCGLVAVDTSFTTGLCLTFTHGLTPSFSIKPEKELVITHRSKKIL